METVSTFTIIYALLAIVALVLLFVYLKMFKDNLNRNCLTISIAVFLIILSYTITSCTKSLDIALFANRLGYLCNIVILIEMYVIINYFCNGENNKTVLNIIMWVSLIIYLLTLTGGTSITLYYKSVELEIVDNLTTLIKVYGPLHSIYAMYVFVMFIIMISRIAYSIYHKIVKAYVNPILLVLIGTENMFVWFAGKLIGTRFELLTISYLICEGLFILLFKNHEDFKKINELADKKGKVSIETIVEEWSNECSLTEREREILELLIDNVSRADIAKALFISEHTVKKHTANLYEKLCVTSRNDLLYKLNEEIYR